jgi:uncharacterized protein with HEPN domain
MSPTKFKSSQVYLERILEHIEKVREYLQKTSREDFEKGGMAFDAICMQLSQMGENVNKLEKGSERIVEKFPDTVNWKQIKGLRNRIDHDYPWLETHKIWDIATNHLDDLEKGIKAILKKRY